MSQSASPRKARPEPKRLWVSFRSVSDPTSAELRRLKKAVTKVPGVSLVGEFSSALGITVEPGTEAALRQRLSRFQKWWVAEEGLAEMPTVRRIME